IDVLAGVVAQRHCGGYATTAEIDKLDFKSPIYIGSTLVIHGKVTCVGRTSMEVKVDTFTEEYSGERKLVNTAYLVLVALDKDGRPVPVPKLICDTKEEKAEEQAGMKRRMLRKKRRDEKF
ncbi:MAG TPA: acyl-CoA thioesterase, partial [Ruminococcaceae bacterium]|nr:acyl-CoA thioesterase [Oscillospiraceae bacterium]